MKIIFCGGGTMGPVSPLLATIETLKKIEPHAVPVWIGTRGGVERAVVTNLGIEYHWIAAAKLRRYFDWQSFLVPFIATAGVCGALWLIIKIAPKAVVVSGAYVQVPIVMIARLLGIPVILHQQDVEVGLANRISSMDATIITAVFDIGLTQFKKRKPLVIGNPVRRSITELTDPPTFQKIREKAITDWGFDPSKPTILFFGGGTGALGLNSRVIENLDNFLSKANVLHLTGKGKTIETTPRKNYVAVEFLDKEMASAYAVSDLVVCRAGLGTISELGALGLTAVLVPLKGHQEKNANYLLERNAVVVVHDDVTAEVFKDVVLRLLSDRDRRLELGRAMANIFPSDSAEKLSRIILDRI